MAEFASKGVAGAGLGLGIAGTALGIMNGGCGNGLGLFGNRNGCYPDERPVTQAEARYMSIISQKDLEISEGKTQVALRDANTFTDQKFNDLRNYVDARFQVVNNELREVAVYQGVNTANIACLKNQVAELQGLTKLYVPSTNICDNNLPVVVNNTACDPVIAQVTTRTTKVQ